MRPTILPKWSRDDDPYGVDAPRKTVEFRFDRALHRAVDEHVIDALERACEERRSAAGYRITD